VEQLEHSHLFFRNFIITHIFVYTSLVVMETATSYVQFYYFSFRYCCAAYFLLLWEENGKKRRLKTMWRGGGKKIRSGGWEEGYTVKEKVHKEVEKIDIFKCLNCFVLSRRKKKIPHSSSHKVIYFSNRRHQHHHHHESYQEWKKESPDWEEIQFSCC